MILTASSILNSKFLHLVAIFRIGQSPGPQNLSKQSILCKTKLYNTESSRRILDSTTQLEVTAYTPNSTTTTNQILDDNFDSKLKESFENTTVEEFKNIQVTGIFGHGN